MKNFIWCLAIVSLFCVTDSLAQKATPQIRKALVQTMIANGDISSACVKDQGGASKAINVMLEDLNQDGQPEYVVSGDGSCCGGARRCNTWIYQKTANGYRKIYGGKDGDQADLEFLKIKTNGYRNIRSTTYSGNEAFTKVFKFNGNTYQ